MYYSIEPKILVLLLAYSLGPFSKKLNITIILYLFFNLLHWNSVPVSSLIFPNPVLPMTLSSIIPSPHNFISFTFRPTILQSITPLYLGISLPPFSPSPFPLPHFIPTLQPFPFPFPFTFPFPCFPALHSSLLPPHLPTFPNFPSFLSNLKVNNFVSFFRRNLVQRIL